MTDPVSLDVPGEKPCRRAVDRRRTSLKSIAYGSVVGRRRAGRRAGDHDDTYLDLHQPHLLFATALTLLLSGLDAFLTLDILSRGGTELNWFMAALIERDIQLFTAVKMALSGTALVVIVMHANFRVFRVLRAWHLIYLVLPMYILLVGYELHLLGKLSASGLFGWLFQ
jgi:hypothetical protein